MTDGSALDPIFQDARMHGGIRVFREEQAITEEGKKQLRQHWQEYMDRTKCSAEKAARSMGVAASIISQVLSGNYAGDSEKYIRTIDRWLENQLLREAAPKPPGFVMTGVAEAIYGVMKWTLKTNSIAVVYGPTGCGKTMTLKAIQAETPGTIYYSIGSSGRSMRTIMDGIADTARLTGLRTSTAQRFKDVAAMFKGTGRLIIVDEVHKLAGRQNDDALHMLRDLHDATDCPMLWSGNGKIATYIHANKTEGNDPIDQIYGRIGWWMDLTQKALAGRDDDGTKLYTVEDIQRVFAASKIRLAPDAVRYLTDMANDPSMGCLRMAKNLVAMAMVAARDQAITADMLRAIQRERLGYRMAEQVEQRIVEATTRAVA